MKSSELMNRLVRKPGWFYKSGKMRGLKSDAFCCFLAVVGEPSVRQKLKFLNKL
jgi:hypothetical protein